MVGKESEQGGMIKHGSKMIQAVSNATVPQITIQCGASFGAGNYGMCGRGYEPRFLFSWPSARTAVMGGEQAARTMQIVTDAALASAKASRPTRPKPRRSSTRSCRCSRPRPMRSTPVAWCWTTA
jgi:acetyl-CoA carboxylase carboxyltransferase component